MIRQIRPQDDTIYYIFTIMIDHLHEIEIKIPRMDKTPIHSRAVALEMFNNAAMYVPENMKGLGQRYNYSVYLSYKGQKYVIATDAPFDKTTLILNLQYEYEVYNREMCFIPEIESILYQEKCYRVITIKHRKQDTEGFYPTIRDTQLSKSVSLSYNR